MALRIALIAGLFAYSSAFAPSVTPISARNVALSRRSTRSLNLGRPLRMSEVDEAESADKPQMLSAGEYYGVDRYGNPVILSMPAKEKLYLEACSSYYNDGKPTLSDEDYTTLKLDLEFEGSFLPLMSREEIKFMVAANRYAEGKPIMEDSEFDALRRKLKDLGSRAVVHKVPSCKVNTGVCKSDLATDTVKNLVVNLPSGIISTVITSEIFYNFMKTMNMSPSPIVSLLITSPVIVGISYAVTNSILLQKPLITRTVCPNCSVEQNIYFGDILFLNGGQANDEVKTICVNDNCRCELRASRKRMVVESGLAEGVKKGAAPA